MIRISHTEFGGIIFLALIIGAQGGKAWRVYRKWRRQHRIRKAWEAKQPRAIR